MINRDRMVEEFIELVRIDSISKNEKEMSGVLKRKLNEMGLTAYEDNASNKIGGNSGNLICTVKGSSEIPPVLLMAHMDTVVPGTQKEPVIDGDFITTDGTTVLGGDDLAGIECILEALRVLKEEQIKHGDIQIVFTVAEEIGLLGSKNLDFNKINAKYAFVLDGGGSIGTVAVKAPSHNQINIVVKGKASHAGMEPEKGINAVKIVSEAVCGMKLGRIDKETTANIGIIKGGKAVNIVCDSVEIMAEARSRDENKLEAQTNHMKRCFEQAAEKYGGSVDFEAVREYPAFNIDEDDPIISIIRSAANEVRVELTLEATGGGSDTNIVNGKGIKAVDVSVGMDRIHSVEERINSKDMAKAAEFLVSIIKNVE